MLYLEIGQVENSRTFAALAATAKSDKVNVGCLLFRREKLICLGVLACITVS